MVTYSSATKRALDTVVFRPVLNDHRTLFDMKLGFPANIIVNSVTEKGRADFTVSYRHEKYGELKPSDRCLLYSFFHIKHHYTVARHLLKSSSVGLPADEPTLFVDLGSGPGTALLAYADTWRGKHIDYMAVDRAQGMLDQAEALFQSLRSEGAVGSKSTFTAATGWEHIQLERSQPTVVFASFLFASRWLDESQLSSLRAFVSTLFKESGEHGCWLIYSNSDAGIANERWLRFSESLGLKAEPKLAEIENRRYSRKILFKKRL